jgi:CMP-N,N'-diacetyllegionaminic acid synthase
MYNGKKIYAMIPARAGSVRLKHKNIVPLLGKPLIGYAIDACKKSKFIDRIYVSTEDETIAGIARHHGVGILKRPVELAQDKIPTQQVMRHFADNIPDFDILVLVQANSPQVNHENIDKAIRLLEDNKLWEVRSVNKMGLENGAFWVSTRDNIYWAGLSVYFGVVQDDAIDIHTEQDLKKAEEAMKNGN